MKDTQHVISIFYNVYKKLDVFMSFSIYTMSKYDPLAVIVFERLITSRRPLRSRFYRLYGLSWMEIMQRRAYERIPTQLDVRFYCNDKECVGTVMNLSENGLLINTKMDFPFDLNFELYIPWDKKILHVPVEITRLEKTGDKYHGIGVQVHNVTDDYVHLVESLKSEHNWAK